MRVDVDLVVHAKIGKFILIQLSFLLLLNFILDTIGCREGMYVKFCNAVLCVLTSCNFLFISVLYVSCDEK